MTNFSIDHANSGGRRGAALALASSLLLGMALVPIISAPRLHGASDATLADSQTPEQKSEPPSQSNPKAAIDRALTADDQKFELQVVGPNGKPIPDALVELRTNPSRAAEQVHRGKFVKRGSNRTLVATDAQGNLVVTLPKAPTDFGVFITTPGYGPYWAGWSSESHAQPVPPRFTAELEAAWSVGGIIVDAAGKAVEGATVVPSVEFKKRPGETRQLAIGTNLKTDAAGEWHFDSVPVSMSELYVGIDHPSFKPLSRSLPRRGFGIERGQKPTAKIVLDRGLMVIGKVTDDMGKPIVGALVRTKFVNDIREAKTDSNGVYRLVGCEPRMARIVVSAAGRATDMKELNIDPGMARIDFQMKPGGTVRVRVLDAQGNPVPKARIFFQQWRGHFSYFEFDHVSQYADKNGVWVWHEAPLDEFKADICPPGGMQLLAQPLIARDEEYVFRAPGALIVSGNVVDAITKQPIKEFRVVPGGRDSQGLMYWNRKESFITAHGRYEIRQTRGDSENLIRIEADGYQAAVSREIKSNEGTISIDFELKTGKNVLAKVVTPRNLPAVGAKVALGIAGSQITIKNGDISDASTFCAREETDGSGRFHFPAQDNGFQLVITHPSGFAHIKSTAEWELTRIIHLEPWSRVEGTFRIGKKFAANVPITLDVTRLRSTGRNDSPHFLTDHQAIAGPDGRFIFDRVIPGTGSIGRRIEFTEDEGATEVTSAFRIPAEFPAGKTIHIELGGTGRLVIGKLQPPDGFSDKVRWSFALVTVGYDVTDIMFASPYFTATVDQDGTFRIDDVPIGNYSLSARLEHQGQVGRLRSRRFTVPAANGNRADQPVDLGVLTMEKP